MSIQKFKKLKVSFHSDEDTLTKKPIDLLYEHTAFFESKLPLFKLAAHEKLS
jgi:hypothetical protein